MRDLWHSLMHSPEAWIIGAVVGLIIFAIFDLLPIGESRIRSLMRLLKNKISEHSTSQLEKRIKELEKYRDSLKLMTASDKLLYLGTFRTIFGTLIFICIGMILLTLRHSVMLEYAATVDPRAADTFFVLDMVTILIFALAIVVAISGVSMALLDTRPKLEEQIAKYDKNVTDLKEILKQQREKLERRAWVRRRDKNWGHTGRSPISIRRKIGDVPSVPGLLREIKSPATRPEILRQERSGFRLAGGPGLPFACCFPMAPSSRGCPMSRAFRDMGTTTADTMGSTRPVFASSTSECPIR